MDFRILGPLEVEDDGRLLKLGGAKQRSVLALLLLHANQVVSRDRLIDELWGASPPETAATALQVYVSQLRKALGHDVIATQPPGYRIRVAAGELDLDRFERLVEDARGVDAARAAERLRTALRLWRGAPLGELPSVARSERARLEEARLAALEQRIEADLELGRHAELVPELEGLVREHPLRERLRGQLMVALYRSGRQAGALDVYRQGRKLLSEELGLEPGEDLRRIERGILEQAPALGASVAAEPQRPTVPTGTVTFLFTDIEGSTNLLRELGDDYGDVLDQHHRLLRTAFEAHGGQEIDSQGDAFFFAFRRARDAVRAAVEAQRALVAAEWPRRCDVRIRIGIHTGEPGFAEAGYHGLDVVRAARISGAAHGGQILVSSATRDLVGDAMADVSFEDRGEHRLKDIEQPQRMFQVVAPDLRQDFSPPRTADGARVMAIGGREEELAAAAEAAVGAEERRLRLFRRSRVAAALGALLIAGVAAGIVVPLTGVGSEEAAVAVVPNSVAVVDPETKKVVGDVPIGGQPVAIAVGAGAVWVGNGDDGTVSRIDPKTYEVVKTIGLGVDVSGIAVGHGSVWVAGGNAGTLTRIDPRLNAVQATIDFEQPDQVIARPVFHVATDERSVWVTESDRLVKIDPRTQEVISQLQLGPAPLRLAAGGGNAFVTSLDERVLRIDAGSVGVTATLDLPSGGLFPVVSHGWLWLVAEPSGVVPNQLWRIDPATMVQTGTAGLPARALWQLAAGEGGLWSADFETGRLLRVDPTTVRLSRVVPVRRLASAIAAGYGRVWIGVQKAFD